MLKKKNEEVEKRKKHRREICVFDFSSSFLDFGGYFLLFFPNKYFCYAINSTSCNHYLRSSKQIPNIL